MVFLYSLFGVVQKLCGVLQPYTYLTPINNNQAMVLDFLIENSMHLCAKLTENDDDLFKGVVCQVRARILCLWWDIWTGLEKALHLCTHPVRYFVLNSSLFTTKSYSWSSQGMIKSLRFIQQLHLKHLHFNLLWLLKILPCTTNTVHA